VSTERDSGAASAPAPSPDRTFAPYWCAAVIARPAAPRRGAGLPPARGARLARPT